MVVGIARTALDRVYLEETAELGTYNRAPIRMTPVAVSAERCLPPSQRGRGGTGLVGNRAGAMEAFAPPVRSWVELAALRVLFALSSP